MYYRKIIYERNNFACREILLIYDNAMIFTLPFIWHTLFKKQELKKKK